MNMYKGETRYIALGLNPDEIYKIYHETIKPNLSEEHLYKIEKLKKEIELNQIKLKEVQEKADELMISYNFISVNVRYRTYCDITISKILEILFDGTDFRKFVLMDHIANTLNSWFGVRDDAEWMIHTSIIAIRKVLKRFCWHGVDDVMYSGGEAISNSIELKNKIQSYHRIKDIELNLAKSASSGRIHIRNVGSSVQFDDFLIFLGEDGDRFRNIPVNYSYFQFSNKIEAATFRKQFQIAKERFEEEHAEKLLAQ